MSNEQPSWLKKRKTNSDLLDEVIELQKYEPPPLPVQLVAQPANEQVMLNWFYGTGVDRMRTSVAFTSVGTYPTGTRLASTSTSAYFGFGQQYDER